MVYIGLTRYTNKDFELLYDLRPDGVVLGDLFCNKRMFPYGGTELVETMCSFKEKGIDVIYQTPMYATDRMFSSIAQAVEYYYQRKMINTVIVQDIGMASYLSKTCKDLVIIWGRMGYARTPNVNLNTIDFYIKNGVNGFECKNLEQVNYIEKIGALAYMMVGYPKYLTVNRECYYKFEHNIFSNDCKCGCLNKEKIMIPSSKEINSTLDGYVLGWENIYTTEAIEHARKCDNSIIYAESFSEAVDKLDIIRLKMNI